LVLVDPGKELAEQLLAAGLLLGSGGGVLGGRAAPSAA